MLAMRIDLVYMFFFVSGKNNNLQLQTLSFTFVWDYVLEDVNVPDPQDPALSPVGTFRHFSRRFGTNHLLSLWGGVLGFWGYVKVYK